MELRLDSRTTQEAIAQARALLQVRRVVLVFGDRLTLSALALTEPIQPSLVGAPPQKMKVLSWCCAPSRTC